MKKLTFFDGKFFDGKKIVENVIPKSEPFIIKISLENTVRDVPPEKQADPMPKMKELFAKKMEEHATGEVNSFIAGPYQFFITEPIKGPSRKYGYVKASEIIFYIPVQLYKI